MAEVKIIRPELSAERRTELEAYLLDHWERAVDGRSQQVDEDYKRWDLNYKGVPRERIRTLPWYGASNFVVQLIRIFIDTFVARSLNIVFATKPLYTVSGFNRELREALEVYINHKAVVEWQHYTLAQRMLQRGAKNGTLTIKTPWVEEAEWAVSAGEGETSRNRIVTFAGPKSRCIPFDDFYVYPITAEDMSEVEIKFHKVRYVEEDARRRRDAGAWNIEEGELESALQLPTDVRRKEEEEEAGVTDNRLKELQAVECHFRYAMWGSDVARMVGVIIPSLRKLVDVYYYPYPRNVEIFHTYRPYPREHFFYGESMCQILEQSQEESSSVHNDRRNNSYIANAPVFKRRSGSLLPNPSSNWYPGKVWDVESMEDFDIVAVGRNYNDMLSEEAQLFQLAERLTGIGPPMQGSASGMSGKRGIYNAMGTIALLQESNQRQDTNIRDARVVLSEVSRTALILQRAYGGDDPSIQLFPDEMQKQIMAALQAATPDTLARCRFEVSASSAGVNKEIERMGLMQMATVLQQYGQVVHQLGQMLLDPKLNPSLRSMITQIIDMHRWMAGRLLRAFDEYDLEGILPDVAVALAAGQQQQQQQPGQPGGPAQAAPSGIPGPGGAGMEPGGSGGSPPVLTREALSALSSLPGGPG